MTDDTDNMRHWHALFATDPRQTKQFVRAGGFRGTAIDPLWRIQQLTAHFGPQGVGWGTEEPRFNVVDAGEETLVYCILQCWYKDNDGNLGTVWGIGGDKVCSKRPGAMFADDEAFKKAFTDALMNAFLRVGLSADIWLGLHQDSKYLVAVREKFDNSRAVLNQIPQQPKEVTPPPTTALQSNS